MKPVKRHIEFLHHIAERGGERGPSADQHVVVAGAQLAGSGRRKSDHLPQTAPHAIALHGVTHLSRHGEPDADRPILGAAPGLEHEGAAGGAHAVRGGSKIAAAFEPLDDGRTAYPITH
jgi:hypothetical protein